VLIVLILDYLIEHRNWFGSIWNYVHLLRLCWAWSRNFDWHSYQFRAAVI
jgi:hypothetical protein